MRMTLEQEINQTEKNLLKMLEEGILKPDTIATNFVVPEYLKKFDNVKILVNGVEHGSGWLVQYVTNFETIRVTWARLRNQKGYDREQEYKEALSKTS